VAGPTSTPADGASVTEVLGGETGLRLRKCLEADWQSRWVRREVEALGQQAADAACYGRSIAVPMEMNCSGSDLGRDPLDSVADSMGS